MELVVITVTILNSIAISLGVGSSTIAIANFFVAISDGKITKPERKLMGVVYITLRVAMGLILFTTAVLALYHASAHGFIDYFTPFKQAIWTLVFVLYLNAILMTKHVISSTFGPAIQASSWYTLGIVSSLLPMNLHNFNYLHFLMVYSLAIAFAVVIVNSLILYVSPKKS